MVYLSGRWDDFETTTTPIPLPFFADKNNLLMYIILPAFIIIVGGSVLLYVVHKLRRAYGKRKEQHKRETQVAPAPNYEKPPATVLMTVVVDGKKTLRAVPWWSNSQRFPFFKIIAILLKDTKSHVFLSILIVMSCTLLRKNISICYLCIWISHNHYPCVYSKILALWLFESVLIHRCVFSLCTIA